MKRTPPQRRRIQQAVTRLLTAVDRLTAAAQDLARAQSALIQESNRFSQLRVVTGEEEQQTEGQPCA